MKIVEWICVGLTGVLVALAALYLRREVISRAGGTVDMNMRLNTFVPERGWSPGLGRFVGDELRWYRLFSFSVRPRRVLCRHGLVVEARRPPEGAERLSLPDGWTVLRCAGRGQPVDIALAQSTVTGFLSWLESAPPGALANYH
jgi:Protein of unknown function (DUF2550)